MNVAWRNKYNPGVTIAVVKDGAKVFADGFGKKDGTHVASMMSTERTLFEIAHFQNLKAILGLYFLFEIT